MGSVLRAIVPSLRVCLRCFWREGVCQMAPGSERDGHPALARQSCWLEVPSFIESNEGTARN